ncbi:hypothetical protein [Enterococcus sp. LJL51]|uniref:hypothetical protein n=1 Tax=Enterococcus sp. LJL51 TaxID=3416656 RepID=UPI003CECFAA2
MEEYKQIYISLENEIRELAYSITLSEKQKKVYSPRIADLVVRAAGLLESALKYFYEKKTGEKPTHYDNPKVISKLKLKDKAIYIHWNLYQFDNRIFIPFRKNEEKCNINVAVNGNLKMNYGWNNAYQNLRHDFIDSIPIFGNLYYLFETMTALYLVLDIGYSSSMFCIPVEKEDGESGWYGWIGNEYGNAITRTLSISESESKQLMSVKYPLKKDQKEGTLVDNTEYTEYIKVNFPFSKEDYFNGNGEGCWVLVTKDTKEKHDSDVLEGMYRGVLSNDSYYYPELKVGSRVLFNMRGSKRPVADWGFLAGLEKISEQNKMELIGAVLKKDNE